MAVKSKSKNTPQKAEKVKKGVKQSPKETEVESVVEEMEVVSTPSVEKKKKSVKEKKQKKEAVKKESVVEEMEVATPTVEKKNKSGKEKKQKKGKIMKAVEKAVAAAAAANADSDEDESDDETAMKKYDNDFGFAAAAEEEKDQEMAEDDESEEEVKDNKNVKSKEQLDDERERTVHAFNVALKTSKKEIIKIFKKYGKVEIVRFRDLPVKHLHKYKIKQIKAKEFLKDRNSMSAYIRFSKVEECKNALAANNTMLNKHHIFVKLSVRKSASENKRSLADGCTLFIGNVPYNTEEESIYKHFSGCGDVKNVVVNRQEHKCVGTTFVTFATKEEAIKALELNGSTYLDRQIRVSKAVRKMKKNKAAKKAQFPKNIRNQDQKSAPQGEYFKKKSLKKKEAKSPKTKDAKYARGKAAKSTKTNAAKSPKTNPKAHKSPKAKSFSGVNSDKKDASKKKKKDLSRDELKKKSIAKKLAKTSA